MATQKAVYFTAGIVPTEAELLEIQALNEAAEAPYIILVANSQANAFYGETERLIPADLVAGSVPTAYQGLPVLDPEALPVEVTDGQTVAVRDSTGADSHNGTAVVEAGTFAGVNLPATVAMVDDTDAVQVPVTGTYVDTVTFTVADGAITAVALS